MFKSHKQELLSYHSSFGQHMILHNNLHLHTTAQYFKQKGEMDTDTEINQWEVNGKIVQAGQQFIWNQMALQKKLLTPSFGWVRAEQNYAAIKGSRLQQLKVNVSVYDEKLKMWQTHKLNTCTLNYPGTQDCCLDCETKQCSS